MAKKNIKYKTISLPDDRHVALGKHDGSYVVQFARPIDDIDKANAAKGETTKTSSVEVIDKRLITALLLSPEALQALVSLYIDDKEAAGYELMIDVKLVKKDN